MQPSASLFFFFPHFSLVFCTFLPFSVAVSLSFTFYVLTHFFALSLFISLSLCLIHYISLSVSHSIYLSTFALSLFASLRLYLIHYISLPLSPFCPFRLTIGSSRSALVRSTPGLRRKRPLLVHCSRPSLLMFSGEHERRREGEQKKRDEKRKRGEEKKGERKKVMRRERERPLFTSPPIPPAPPYSHQIQYSECHPSVFPSSFHLVTPNIYLSSSLHSIEFSVRRIVSIMLRRDLLYLTQAISTHTMHMFLRYSSFK